MFVTEPTIAAMRGRNPENPSDRSKGTHCEQRLEVGENISNTLTSVQKDNLLVEPKVKQIGNIVDDSNRNFKNPQAGRVYSVLGLAPAMTCCGGGNLEPKISEFKGKLIRDSDGLYLYTSNKFYRGPLKGISRTIKSEQHDAGVCLNFRIRKLTPKECFRLMDVSEINIDKLMNSGISNSQLYKLAGNSIVVSCLYHIFRKLFVDKENESNQLTLF